MWALPMTSWQKMLRKPFSEAKGRTQDFQLPIQAGLHFPSSIIKFPFILHACMSCRDTDMEA